MASGQQSSSQQQKVCDGFRSAVLEPAAEAGTHPGHVDCSLRGDRRQHQWPPLRRTCPASQQQVHSFLRPLCEATGYTRHYGNAGCKGCCSS